MVGESEVIPTVLTSRRNTHFERSCNKQERCRLWPAAQVARAATRSQR